MITKYVLPLLAVAGVGFAIFTVVQARQVLPPVEPVITPPTPPKAFRYEIAGAGLVEARRENIPIGSPVAGVVWEVFVQVHDRVREGDPLFRLDDRALQAELKVREAERKAAEAQLERLRASPREEDVPPLRAAVEEAKARLDDAEAAMARSARLFERKMIAASDYDRDRFAYQAARAALAKARADLQRLEAGAWAEDLKIAEAEVARAASQLDQIRTERERLTVRALTDGEVLQINVRPGQFAAMAWREPLIILGDVDRLHVRVDIDEHDLHRFVSGAPAYARLRGRPEPELPLEFVKVEPYVIPKTSLTGDNAERVDTRVLQVIYALPEAPEIPVYVGQQVDVFIEAPAPLSTNTLNARAEAIRPQKREP